MKFLTALLLTAGIGFAQSGPPMQLFVFLYPPSIATGTSVNITGNVPLDGNGTGRMVITPPSQPPITVKARWDASGTYTADFCTTKWPGTYKVEVFSPGGHAYGTQTFTAKPAKEMVPEVQSGEDFTVKLVQTDIKAAEDMVDEIPPSPATKDAQARLKLLQQQVDEFRAQAEIEAAFEPVLKAVDTAPDLRSAGVLKSIAAWRAQAKTRTGEYQQQIARLRQKSANCEKLDQLNQLMDLLAPLLEIAGGPFKIISEQYPQNARSAAANQWMTRTKRLGAETASSIAQAGSAKYCEQYQGPFTATLHAEFSKSAGPWWKYDERLTGTLTLRYAKGAPSGQSVRVTGEFKGTADKFTCWEDALPVLYADLMKDARATSAFKKATLPEPAPFVIPAEGEITGGKLTLRIGSATVDLQDDLATHVVNVVVSPMMLAPKVVAFDLPYKNAHAILTRATSEKPLEIPVNIDSARKVAIVAKDFQRTMTPAEAKASYSLSVKACNPKCQ